MISEGTLLGAYRQGSFIPHDTDIDVGVVGPVPTLRLLRALRRSGFIPVRLLWSGLKIQQVATCYRPTGDIFDIVIWWPDNDEHMVLRFPELNYDMRAPKWQFTESVEVMLDGRGFRTHADPESWLVAQYGSTWRVPESAKSDWRRGDPFRDTGFGRAAK